MGDTALKGPPPYVPTSPIPDRRAVSLALSLPSGLNAQTAEDARIAFEAEDFARAVEIAVPLAAQGDVGAQSILGLLYAEGLGGLPYDGALAVQNMRAAADGGSAAAQNNLARVFHFGLHGQPVDPVRAAALYQQAIAGNSEFALNNYAVLLEEGHFPPVDWNQILGLYEEAALLNEPNAAANLANIYYHGTAGVARDYVLSRQWAERSLEVNSARGMRILGILLEFGDGGPQDVPRAEALYRQSYNLGDAAAANDLGLMFWNGAPGVPADLVTAAEWFERGVAGDDTWAHVNLGDLLNDGDASVPDDPFRARALYQVAHDRGNLEATVALSYLHWDGVGGPVNYDEARRLLIYASEEGDVGAMNDLGVMLQQGLGGAVDIYGAAHLYQRAAQQGHTLGAQNLAYILLDPSKEPSDPVEGLAWCYFSVERESRPERQQEYRTNCTELEADVTPDARTAAISRSAQLLSQF